MKKVYFSGGAIIGDVYFKKPIRFYFKMIGFEDIVAKNRSWGFSEKDMRELIRKSNNKPSLLDKILLFFGLIKIR